MTRRGALGRTTAIAAATVGGMLGCASRPVPTPPRASGVPEPVLVPYGAHPDQHAVLHLPARGAALPVVDALPVVVVVHGGFWRSSYGAELGTPLAADLAGAGLAAWNLEYRRVGGGGGWPTTFTDVAAGVDALASAAQQAAGGRLDLGRVVLVGHSAGGQLAVWAAGRHRLPAGLPAPPGADPVVRPVGAVSQAGVLDLVDGAQQGLGGGAVAGLLGGGPDAVPDRYRLASPVALAPLGVPVVCVHGIGDGIVPLRQSERFVAVAGGQTELVALPGVGHFELIDPSQPAWIVCRDAVIRLLGL
ncbi:MAG: alpha/beta hydrolase family protein [Pseudonocardiales bacterium]